MAIWLPVFAPLRTELLASTKVSTQIRSWPGVSAGARVSVNRALQRMLAVFSWGHT
jgi:hypothetical protein